jgi:AcrR family transcriptional regulator
MEDVAREAGVAKGTVYLYYTTKAELLAHTLLLEQQEKFDQLKSLFERDLDPRTRLVEVLRVHLLASRQMPLTLKLMDNIPEMVVALEEIDAAMDIRHEEWNQRLNASLIDDACPGRFTAEELAERTALLHATLMGVSLLKGSAVDDLGAERLADLLTETLVAGLTGTSA